MVDSFASQELILVRHASATGQEALAELTDEGRAQARVLAGLLLPYRMERVISSPFVRATETIRPLCERANLQLETDPRLVERVLSGQPLADWRDHLRRSFDDFDYRLEGGESARAAQRRGMSVLQSALESKALCVLVTHGNLLALMLNAIDGSVGFDHWSKLSNPDAFIVGFEPDAPAPIRRIWSARAES